jgi:hypothetical protein
MENLINQEKPIYDHIRYGKNTIFFVLPPKISSDYGFDKEALKEISLEKIAELEIRLDEITKKFREQEEELLSNNIPINLNLPYLVAQFGFKKEKFYIQKWLEYWKNLVSLGEKVDTRRVKKWRRFKDRVSMDFDIERAKSYPIENLYQGKLRQVSGKLQGLCPFHEEKTPSFFIFPDNHFYCFGCQEHGSSIDFLMKIKNIDFISAVKELQR